MQDFSGQPPHHQEMIYNSVSAACRCIGMSRSEYYQRVADGLEVFPSINLPGRSRPLFFRSSILEWLRSHEGQPEAVADLKPVTAPPIPTEKKKRGPGRPTKAEKFARGELTQGGQA